MLIHINYFHYVAHYVIPDIGMGIIPETKCKARILHQSTSCQRELIISRQSTSGQLKLIFLCQSTSCYMELIILLKTTSGQLELADTVWAVCC